jgi:hypothetical protein
MVTPKIGEAPPSAFPAAGHIEEIAHAAAAIDIRERAIDFMRNPFGIVWLG